MSLGIPRTADEDERAVATAVIGGLGSRDTRAGGLTYGEKNRCDCGESECARRRDRSPETEVTTHAFSTNPADLCRVAARSSASAPAELLANVRIVEVCDPRHKRIRRPIGEPTTMDGRFDCSDYTRELQLRLFAARAQCRRCDPLSTPRTRLRRRVLTSFRPCYILDARS